MRQVIIARKDLHMNPGKLSAQVSHASFAFLSMKLRGNAEAEEDKYKCTISLDKDVYEDWICDKFTKTVCQAKNKNHLLKAVKIAEELGLKEGEDFFLIKDACLTDLEPEEFNEEGEGSTLTCIGFKPMDDETAHKISMKFHLYV